jgi:hypothetical protein
MKIKSSIESTLVVSAATRLIDLAKANEPGLATWVIACRNVCQELADLLVDTTATDAAVAEEREACARLVEEIGYAAPARAIRQRGDG